MGKKTEKGNRRGIGHIPEYAKQPRSSPPKRRTNFSTFLSRSSSSSPFSLLSSNSGSSGKGLSSAAITSSDGSKEEIKDEVELPPAQCSSSLDGRSRLLSEFYELPVAKVKLVAPSATIGPTGARFLSNPLTIGETSSAANLRSQDADGHIPIQFTGDHYNAWLDPVKDISQLEDFLEARSSNSEEDYASEQSSVKAFGRKQALSSCGHLHTADASNHSNQHVLEKWTASIPSKTKGNFLEREKGKREQKPVLCIPEVNCPLKSEKVTRRLRIMRHLGLIAPVGSPF